MSGVQWMLAPLLALLLVAANADVAGQERVIQVTAERFKVTRVRIVPDKAATYDFHCSVFCGSGHEEMAGQIVVSP